MATDFVDYDRAGIDGCDMDDPPGLKAALVGATLLEAYGYEEGWGHHAYDDIYQLADGRYLHVECGGCSCGGRGTWATYDGLEEARLRVPEWTRETKR
jgi:hypothetical protein